MTNGKVLGTEGGKTYNRRLQSLWVLDVDSLDIREKSMLCALLIVTSAGDTDTKTVRDTLDALLPDLLIQLGVDTDILGSLFVYQKDAHRDSRLKSLRIWSLRWTRRSVP